MSNKHPPRDFAWHEARLRILSDWRENRVSQAFTLKRLVKLGMTIEKALEEMRTS